MTITWQELDAKIRGALRMFEAPKVTGMRRVFTFTYRGLDFPYEVKVTCAGRVVTDIEPQGWEPSPMTSKILGELAVDIHLDWWDEMVANTPAERKKRDDEAERRSDIRDKYRHY